MHGAYPFVQRPLCRVRLRVGNDRTGDSASCSGPEGAGLRLGLHCTERLFCSRRKSSCFWKSARRFSGSPCSAICCTASWRSWISSRISSPRRRSAWRKNQKDYFLREQMRVIQEELGKRPKRTISTNTAGRSLISTRCGDREKASQGALPSRQAAVRVGGRRGAADLS